MELFTLESFIIISQLFGIIVVFELAFVGIEKTIDVIKKVKDI